MKIKSIFYLSVVSCSLLLVSCGGMGGVKETKTADSSAVKTSDDLQKLNAQLLAGPNNAELYYNRARYYLNSKNYELGLADMQRALKIDSTKSKYFLTLSDFYFVINKTGSAKTALEKSIKLDDKNVDAMLKLAELYLYVRKNEQSMKYINMALKVNQYNAEAYFMKGMNYKDLKDTARAISSMQTAVEQDQKYYQAYIQLGIFSSARKNPLAVQYYKNAIKIQPKSSEAWYNLGKFYQDIGDWNNALGTYTALIQIEPANKNANYNMGVIYLLRLKKYDTAINHFTAAIKIDPKYVEAYFGRGLSYQSGSGKDLKLASLDFDACLAINPKFEPAQTALKELGKK